MATKYLLHCDCGSQHPVTTHQAGSQVSCECGQRLDIPPLRKLRHLPLQPELPSGRSGVWTLRHAFATGGTIVCLALLAWAGWLLWTEPEVPQIDPNAYIQMVERGLEQASPADLWDKWHFEYESLAVRGFEVFDLPQRDYWQSVAQKHQLSRNLTLAIAGVAALVSAAVWFAWPHLQPNR
ncbi:MAG: hypothetical protein ACR2NU_13925 [Aeoliella sp.]